MSDRTDQSVQLTIRRGVDWWVAFAYTTADGTPIAITGPLMEIRAGRSADAPVLFTTLGLAPTLELSQPQAHRAVMSLSGAHSLACPSSFGFWDAYGTDPDEHRVYLGGGYVEILRPVSAL